MLADNDFSKLCANLLVSIKEIYADDPNVSTPPQDLIKIIAEVSATVFVEGIREYEKLKSESQDSVN